MSSKIKHALLRPVPHLFSDRAGKALARMGNTSLKEELCGQVTDSFLELLLRGMDLAFCLMKGYRKNIRNFRARYLFTTADGLVQTSALFADRDMKVRSDAIEDWDVKVTFQNAPALQSFLFSRDQDILNSVLRNEVEVEGNLNLVYKLGFMARDLGRRLGVAA